MLCHTDGENHGLMDLLHESGMDIAEAVCPYPMTKVTLAEYYRQWSDRITILGGIPSNLLLRETTNDAQFEKFLDDLFPAVSPGWRFILGVADTTPPDASFERLRRIEEVMSRRGRLPLAEDRPRPADSPREGRIELAATGTSPMAPLAGQPASPFCDAIRSAILSGENDSAVRLVRQAMEKDADPGQLLKECLLAPMDIIGERFTDGTVFIPEVLLSARALNEAMAVLEPALAKQGAGREENPLVLIGTVRGDMHDIGKNLVGIMIRSAGFRVKDLGVNVAAKTFVDAVAAEKPAILALSALLTTTMPEFRTVVEGIERAGLRGNVKILVGGAPITEQYAMSVGADAYGSDAGQAAAKAKLLCGKSKP
jgi:5-methyltetrahydrofolate--homocysteine methyltransferase